MASILPSSTAPAAASTATPMAGISSSQEAGIIAGGVIAAVLLFAVAGFFLYKYERRSRSRRTSVSLNDSSETLVEKGSMEKGKEETSPVKSSPTIPPLDPIPAMTMTTQPVQNDTHARTFPNIDQPTSILRRPDDAVTPERADPLRRGLTLRFRDDTIRPPPPGPLHLVGSPATDVSADPIPWQASSVSSPPSRRTSLSTPDPAPVKQMGLPPRPARSPSRAQSASRTTSPMIFSDVLPPRSAPPSAFGFANDPFRTPSVSDDGHGGRRSLDSISEGAAPSPAAPASTRLRSISISTDQSPAYRAVSPTPVYRVVSPPPMSRIVSPPPMSRIVSPPPMDRMVPPPPMDRMVSPPPMARVASPPSMSRVVSPSPMTRTVSQMPISRTVSLRRAPSAGRPGLPATPRPTVVIPTATGPQRPMRLSSAGIASPAYQLRSLDTPVYPSQYSPFEEAQFQDQYYTVDLGQPALARATSARELHRMPTGRAAPMLWRHPTARTPRSGVDMV
ncbi:hypothetical protein PENSPDRAFT_251206 [Peniophora sp. CONT]|nr:hypothetical protein PENSPDRAFT_251206 [Peniophora sp. CONT]